MSVSVTPAAPCVRSTGKSNSGFNERAVILFGAAVLLFGAVFWAARGPNVERTDFTTMYVGARMVHQGDGAKLYDLREQANLRDSLYTRAAPLIYEHPPFEALLFAPLTSLPYKTAYLVWGLINVLIWLVLPILLRPYAPVPKDELGYITLWFLFAPLGVALYQGQPSLLLLLLYAMTYISLKRGRDLSGGMCLGLGLFKFQFVLPFVLIFFFRRKWRFLAGFLLSGAALGALSLFAVGWQGLLSYVHLLLTIAGNPENLSYGKAVDMATVRGFVSGILGHSVGKGTINTIVAAISVSLVLFTAWRWNKENRQRPEAFFDLMFAAALVVSLVTGFHMFTHDLSPLLLAMLLVAGHFPAKGRTALRWAFGTTLALLWIPPVYFALVAWHRMYFLFPVLIVFAFAAYKLAETPEILTEGNRVAAQ
jgi:hypothetical protein